MDEMIISFIGEIKLLFEALTSIYHREIIYFDLNFNRHYF